MADNPHQVMHLVGEPCKVDRCTGQIIVDSKTGNPHNYAAHCDICGAQYTLLMVCGPTEQRYFDRIDREDEFSNR